MVQIFTDPSVTRVDVNHLMDYFYSLYAKNSSSVWDVKVHVTGNVSIFTKARCLYWLQSKVDDRVTYLKLRYKFEKTGPNTYTFTKGCFETVRYDQETGIAYVTYKWRSEWFRKCISDYLYIKWLTGCMSVVMTIPNLWIRRFELPVIVEWARTRGLQIHPTHEKAYAGILKKYTLQEVVKTSHSITRRYMLRYYLLHKQISHERYLYHVHKMWSERAGNEEEWDRV